METQPFPYEPAAGSSKETLRRFRRWFQDWLDSDESELDWSADDALERGDEPEEDIRCDSK